MQLLSFWIKSSFGASSGLTISAEMSGKKVKKIKKQKSLTHMLEFLV